MPAKKLDLGSYRTGTGKTQTNHSKYKSYLENDTEEQKASSPKKTDKAAVSEKTAENPSKRINMAFSQRNYSYIYEKTEAAGLTIAYFVSGLIKNTEAADVEGFLNAQPVRVTREHVSRRRGMPAKRINIRFDGEAYSKMTGSSERLGITLTQYVNSVLSLAQEKNY